MTKRELIKTDKNGTKYFKELVKCDRCGGTGIYTWGGTINGKPMFAGTCYKCCGAQFLWDEVKEYTPEYRAKLDAANERRKAKQQEKWEAEREKREAERRKAEEERRKAEEERRKAEEARKAISQYVGEIGKRETFTVTLEKCVKFEVTSYMGFGTDTKRIYIFADADGNKIVWKTTGILWKDPDDWNKGSVQEGETVKIKGTIKEHGEFNGEKQTEINRVKMA